jgi:hypothetical protein
MSLEAKEGDVATLGPPWPRPAQIFKSARDQQIRNIHDGMGAHEFTEELCEYQRQQYEDLLNKLLELASRKAK